MAALTAAFDVPIKPGVEIRIQAAAVKNYRGGAAAVVMGVGYATPLVPATAAHRFIGVYLEGNDNSGGVAGTIVTSQSGGTLNSWVRIQRQGTAVFNQTGIVQASVGQNVYFSDDNTVTITAGAVWAGVIVTVNEQNSTCEVDISNAVMPLDRVGMQIISASGAVAARSPGTFVVTKAGVAALTLAAPTATADDGMEIIITSGTAQAHTLTATGLLNTGSASVNLATFAAFAGAGVTLMAYQGKWNVLASVGVTFT